MNVLLSVRPRYADAIMRGEKRFEFRRSLFKHRDVERVFIYATSPVKRIIGSFSIKAILHERPQDLWKVTKASAGICKEDFFEYFKRVEKGYAIEIDGVVPFKTPLDPSDVIPDFTAPRSFRYVPDSLDTGKSCTDA